MAIFEFGFEVYLGLFVILVVITTSKKVNIFIIIFFSWGRYWLSGWFTPLQGGNTLLKAQNQVPKIVIG